MSAFTKEQLMELADAHLTAFLAGRTISQELEKRALNLSTPDSTSPLIDEFGRYLTVPDTRTRYWVPDGGIYGGFEWANDEADIGLLKRGECFTSRAAAEAADRRRICEQEERLQKARGK